MIDDMLKLVVDPLFPPENKPEKRENGFELIYCTHHSKFTDKPVNVRQDLNVPIYPIPELKQRKNPRKEKEENKNRSFHHNIVKRKRTSTIPKNIKVKPKIKNLDESITTLIETYPFEDYDPFIKPVKSLIYLLTNYTNLNE